MLNRVVVPCVLLFSLVLSACGGGGGGGGGLKLRFLLNALSATYYDWDIPDAGGVLVDVDARVTGSTGAPQIFVLFTDNNGTFDLSAPANFFPINSNTFRAQLPLAAGITTGTHSGTLETRLCSDINCANVLTSDTLSYSVQVRPNPTLTFAPAGSLVGKALVASAGDPTVAGFTMPTFSFAGAVQVPIEYREFIYVNYDDPDDRLTLTGGDGGGADYVYLDDVPQNGSVQLNYNLAANLPAGVYTGVLNFQLCRDAGCQMKFSGTSSLPYTLAVAADNMTTLDPAAGAPEWQTTAGNPQHTSYVPMAVDAAAFAPRWVSRVGRTAGNTDFGTDLVTVGGRVVVAQKTAADLQALFALDETDGSLSWQKEFSDGGFPSPMLVANGSLYVRTGATGVDTRFYGLDPATGAELFAPVHAVHGPSGRTPVALDGNVLFKDAVVDPNTGTREEYNLYAGDTGALLTVPSCLRDVEMAQKKPSGFLAMTLAPATRGSKAYIASGAGIEVVDFGVAQSCTHLNMGSDVYSDLALGPTDHPLYNTCYSFGNSSPDTLFNVEPATLEHWVAQSSGTGACSPGRFAVSGNTVYLINPTGGIDARSEATGALLWTASLAGLEAGLGQVVATDNMLFVKGSRLHAIDTATHKVVWSLGQVGGYLSLSPSGVLYLVNREGNAFNTQWTLVAINVR